MEALIDHCVLLAGRGPLPTVVINILVVRYRPGIRFKIVQFPGQRPVALAASQRR